MKLTEKIYTSTGKILGKIPFIPKVYEKMRYSFFISEEDQAKKLYNFEEHESYFKNAHKLTIFTNDNESGGISGEIVKFTKEIAPNIKNIFLPGENNKTKEIYKNILLETGKDDFNIITGGLSKNVDVVWNFEDEVPNNIGKFDLIVSQAMIEHIIDPYKHMKDLVYLLNESGYLLINTNTPSFPYHRYPIDCLRYNPDWFEEISKRLNIKVVKKYMNKGSIFYFFKKDLY